MRGFTTVGILRSIVWLKQGDREGLTPGRASSMCARSHDGRPPDMVLFDLPRKPTAR